MENNQLEHALFNVISDPFDEQDSNVVPHPIWHESDSYYQLP